VSYQYGQFTPTHLEKIREGVELFNEQKYWECHEALEDLWLEDRQDTARLIYWAIIQVAAACIHYRNKNLVGAQGMIAKAKDKFLRTRSEHALTDVVLEHLDWVELEGLVFAISDEKPELEEFADLFEFRFKEYRV
jgi:predicted metal-dependent hydrolase